MSDCQLILSVLVVPAGWFFIAIEIKLISEVAEVARDLMMPLLGADDEHGADEEAEEVGKFEEEGEGDVAEREGAAAHDQEEAVVGQGERARDHAGRLFAAFPVSRARLQVARVAIVKCEAEGIVHQRQHQKRLRRHRPSRVIPQLKVIRCVLFRHDYLLLLSILGCATFQISAFVNFVQSLGRECLRDRILQLALENSVCDDQTQQSGEKDGYEDPFLNQHQSLK